MKSPLSLKELLPPLRELRARRGRDLEIKYLVQKVLKEEGGLPLNIQVITWRGETLVIAAPTPVECHLLWLARGRIVQRVRKWAHAKKSCRSLKIVLRVP